jgi:hypothetical protein
LSANDCFGFLCLQAADIAAAIAADNSRAGAIFISGVTGERSSFINGLFRPTKEMGSDGRVVYAKRTDDGSYWGGETILIIHDNGHWLFQPESVKGSDTSLATFHGWCALEDCKEKILRVYDGEAFKEQPNVKMATGAEAQASGACSI